MKKSLVPLSFTLILLVIFVFGILLFEDVADNRTKVTGFEIPLQQFVLEQFESKNYQKFTPKEYVVNDDDHAVLDIYEVLNANGEKLGYVYLTKTKGWKPNMKTFVALNSKDWKIIGYQVLESSETLLHDLPWKFKGQFENADITKGYFEFEAKGGVTKSSTGIINAVKLARQQFYKDQKRRLPSSIELISVEFADFDTLTSYRYNLKSATGTEYSVVVSYDPTSNQLTYVDAGTLTDAEKTETMSFLNINKPGAWFTGIVKSGGTTEITVKGIGHSSLEDPIVAKATIDSTGKITFVIESHTGETPSYWDNVDLDEIIEKGVAFNPNGSGATESSTGVKNMYVLVLSYVEEVIK